MGNKRKRESKQPEAKSQPKPDEPQVELKVAQSLYEVLGVDSNSTHEEIRKAYHKLALRLHPDKNPGDESAKDKFQTLQKVFSILGDKEKRKIYDETGYTGDEDLDISGKDFNELYAYFRTIYKAVSVEDIIAIENEYRGSKEEKKDLFSFYNRFSGNMNKVFAWLMCSDPEIDSHRFMHSINSAIDKRELPEFKVFRKWANKISKQPEPKNPLQKKRNDSDNDGMDELKAMIQSRQAVRAEKAENLLAKMEAKYCSGGSSKSNGRQNSSRKVVKRRTKESKS